MNAELEKAKQFWARMSGLDHKDLLLTAEALELEAPLTPKQGWIKDCREALMIGQNEVAKRLEISRQAFAKLECNEAKGAISILSLRKVAEAMDCEVVYFLRPLQKKNFSTVIWEKLIPEVLRAYKIRERSKFVRPIVLASIALSLLKDPHFRREHKWARNIEP